ncbi:serine hydrolase domain-containing protein [Pelagerythrobacter aerophilus]
MLRWLVALALAVMPLPASAQDDYAEFGAFLEQVRKDSATPSLSAVIVKDGRIAWEGYFGTYDDEGDLPTTADTTYSIASVTKPIAATAILAEGLAGDLALDTPMSADPGWADTCEWLSGSPIPFGGGGIDRLGNPIAPMDCARPTTLAEMLDMRANGDAFVYNPIAFARIDRAISGAGGRTLRAIVRDRVAEPSGMRNVALGWHDPEGGDALRFLAPPFHVIHGRPVKQAISDDDFRAAAGIKASPRALAAFDIAYDAGVLIPPALRKRLLEDVEIGPLGDYRQGWWLEDWNGQRLMWHSGWDEKRYSALYLKVPGKRLTLIVLANTEALWWGNSLVKTEVSESPVARQFLERYAE